MQIGQNYSMTLTPWTQWPMALSFYIILFFLWIVSLVYRMIRLLICSQDYHLWNYKAFLSAINDDNLFFVFLYSLFLSFSLITFLSPSNLLIVQINKPVNSNYAGKCGGHNIDHLYINNVVSWAIDSCLVLPHVAT